MSRIAIVTPNTDTFTNPTLTTLFHLLQEKGVEVYLFGREQQPACPENISNVIQIRSLFKLHLLSNPKHLFSHWKSYFKVIRTIRIEKIDVILAVDPLGLIVGGRIKQLLGNKLHLSYLSFEIFFKEELSGHYLKMKHKEIYYSKLFDSLLVQDEKRCDLLLKENKILLDANQIALVPVSPMKIEVQEKPNLHSKFNIPTDKKLVVYSGSVGAWCGTQVIIEAFDKGYWNNAFWLVFHTRKQIQDGDQFAEDLYRLDANPATPFSLHPNPFESFEELAVFLTGFDLALALYYPNFANPYYGKNMMEIGLSSGKFSTYMMLGLPTIVTPCEVYEVLMKKYNFGGLLVDINNIGNLMLANNYSNEIIDELYEKVLNPKFSLNKYIGLLNL
jgi:hypothetical protein